MELVSDLIYIVLASIIGGFIAQFFRQPLVLGYILAGVIVGPYTGGVTLARIHDIEKLAEIGVALLLFTLGLEFSFGELKRYARIAFFGTPIQIVLCAVSAYGAGRLLGLSWGDAIWIGAATALSSTMVVLKTLEASEKIDSESSRIMLTILIAQDLALVPLMLILPELTSEQIDFSLVGLALFKSAVFLAFMFIAGTRIFPRLFSLIARWGSRELFFLTTLGVALGTGLLTYHFGLSFALGAFVAGMLLSETDFNHRAMSDVASLRDLFGLIFFVSVGLLFDPLYLIDNLSLVLLFVVLIIIAKASVTAGVVKLFGFGSQRACIVGLALSQVGEFAFVIGNTGHQSGVLSQGSYSLLISTAVVSMVTTPGLFWIGNRLARYIGTLRDARAISRSYDHFDLTDHVVIIGGGVVGQYVAKVLQSLQRPYVVIESDYKTITHMRDLGLQAISGDGTHRVILEGAKLGDARLVVVATTNDSILPTLLGEVNDINRAVPIVVRVEELQDLEELAFTDIHEIVQPQLEVGLEMVRQSLLALGVSDIEILNLLGKLRSKRYDPISKAAPSTEEQETTRRKLSATRLLGFSWLQIEDHLLEGEKKLIDLKLREKFGISIVAVIRGEEVTPNPGPHFVVMRHDLLGILGTQAQIDAFKETFGQS